LWKLRTELMGDGIQPRTIVTRYREAATAARGSECALEVVHSEPQSRRLPPAAAAMSNLG
jgi:hypothetical protein